MLLSVWYDDTVNLAAWQQWLGRPVDMVDWHVHHKNGWWWYLESIRQEAPKYILPGKAVQWTVPPLIQWTGDGPQPTMAQALAGEFDETWREAARRILAAQPTGDRYIRVGHEFNGTWYPWRAQTPADLDVFRRVFRRFVKAFRSVSRTGWQFVWCPNRTVLRADGTPVPVELGYPGDEFCDVVAMDAYRWEPWPDARDSARGLAWLAEFAADHGKPLALGEFGLRGDEDAVWLRQITKWAGARCLYASYWLNKFQSDKSSFIGSDGGPVVLPSSAAAFRAQIRA